MNRWYLPIPIWYLPIPILILLACACGPGRQVGGGDAASVSPATPKASKSEPNAPEGTTTTQVPNVPFTMFGGDKGHRNRAGAPGPAGRPTVYATFDCGARIFASPVIGPDGTVYIGALDGGFNALTLEGRLRWSYTCDEPIFSTAAISQTGLVYVGCDNDTLFGLTTDGMLRFTYRTTHDMDSPPVIDDDGTIYVGGDGVHALTSGGKRLWKASTNGHVSAAVAVRNDGAVVVGSHDNAVYAFDRQGTALWGYGTKAKVLSTATVLFNNDVVIGNDAGWVFRLAAQEGGMRWQVDTGGPVRGGFALSDDGTIIYGANLSGVVFALSLKDGSFIWKRQIGPVRATPVLDSEGRLYIGSRDGGLYAIVADTGDIVWRLELGTEIDSSVTIASQRRLVVGADNAVVYFLKERP